jgi:hypothetical protein
LHSPQYVKRQLLDCPEVAACKKITEPAWPRFQREVMPFQREVYDRIRNIQLAL